MWVLPEELSKTRSDKAMEKRKSAFVSKFVFINTGAGFKSPALLNIYFHIPGPNHEIKVIEKDL